jgi:hypothetical protein
MNYFTDSAWDYIASKISGLRQVRSDRRLLVTVPRLSEEATMVLADTFASKCIAADVPLTLKIAEVVWASWTSTGKQRAKQQGWLDDTGSLTSWRNQGKVPDKISLVVLCGADRVTDAGSLSDFNCCDLEVVWDAQMKGSFRSWVSRKLATAGVDAEGADPKDFDRILVPLLDHGKADLLNVGNLI